MWCWLLVWAGLGVQSGCRLRRRRLHRRYPRSPFTLPSSSLPFMYSNVCLLLEGPEAHPHSMPPLHRYWPAHILSRASARTRSSTQPSRARYIPTESNVHHEYILPCRALPSSSISPSSIYRRRRHRRRRRCSRIGMELASCASSPILN